MNELEIAISEYLDSCNRNGKDNDDDNISYFLRENDHLNLDEDEVRRVFEKFNSLIIK